MSYGIIWLKFMRIKKVILMQIETFKFCNLNKKSTLQILMPIIL